MAHKRGILTALGYDEMLLTIIAFRNPSSLWHNCSILVKEL